MSGFPPHGLLPLSHAGYLLSRPNAFDQDLARALSAEEMQPVSGELPVATQFLRLAILGRMSRCVILSSFSFISSLL
jgi:hypothetical protein